MDEEMFIYGEIYNFFKDVSVDDLTTMVENSGGVVYDEMGYGSLYY